MCFPNNFRELPNKNLKHPFTNFELLKVDLSSNLVIINNF